MKKISTKVIIAAVLLVVVSLSSFAMLSFSLADENNGASNNNTAVFAASNSYTQIDRIIDNSNKGGFGDTEDKIYHIVEITSGKKSSLETLCQNVFKDYVIDGHRSIADVMAANSIDYQSFIAGTDDVDAQIAAIKKADLIYVHNDPDNIYSDDKATDIKEDVKLALSTAATSDHKPFIIDSYKGTMDNKTSAPTYNTMVASVFNTSLATYPWPNSDAASIEEFFGMKIISAFYTRIRGNSVKANWIGTDSKTAKILVIGKGTLYNNINGHTTDLINYGYVQAQSLPNDFDIQEVAPGDDLSSYDLESYDYIILDTGCDQANISTENYNAISAAAYARVHILFSSKLSKKASSSTGSTENPGSSYGYIYEKVATTAETPKFGNVLVTNFSKMDIYANANRPKTVDDIANIIINGSFRGIKGNDSGDDTTNVYTVLEIEPSYPIDSNLATAFYDKKTYSLKDKEFGEQLSFMDEKYGTTDGATVLLGSSNLNQKIFYYLRTNSVINGLTEDEISFDGQTPFSMFENYDDYANAVETTQTANNSDLKDYYRWRLSKAKIAHATGLDYNQVKVVHMSSAEFNTSREALSDAYDAIYIGGDTSNQKVQEKWDNGGQYRMYYRDGDNNNSVSGTSGTFRSNDISDYKRDELIKYASSLPVIIDTEIVDAITKGNGVDPNSNMGKVISAIKGNDRTLYGFDSSKTVRIINPEGQYGNTYGGIVTVFAGKELHSDYPEEEVYQKDATKDAGSESSNGTALRKALTSAQRPKLSVTTPKEYVETDASTWITKDDFNYTYNVNGASKSDNITVQLLIDENGNGTFEDTEVRFTTTGSSGTFNPKVKSDGKVNDKWLGDDFFGPVYWKLVVTDSGYGTSTSTSALSKVKRTNQGKMKVKLLQITPETENMRGADASNMTLYLCTECQMSKRIMHGNLSFGNNNGRYSQIGTDSLNKTDGHTDIFSREVNSATKSILSFGGSSGSGGSSGTNSVTFHFQRDGDGGCYTNNTGYWEESTVTKGRSVVISNLKSGGLKIISPYVDGQGFTLKVTSSAGNITVGENETKVIQVSDDGIVKVDFPDPNATTATSTEKEYNSIVDFLTNDDENYDYDSYGNVLGIHDHKFGIVKYDAHELRYRDKYSDTVYQEGFDKLNTNWFLDFQNDYEVETTILDIPQYTEYVDNVEAVYSDVAGDREAVKAKRDTYYKASEKYYRLYNSVRKIINGTSLDDIDDPTTDEVNEKDELIDYLMAQSGDGLSMGADFSDGTLTYKNKPTKDQVETMLNAYRHSSENIDSYLKKNRETIYTDKVNCRKDEYDSEIDHYIDDSIEPTQRSYYFFFSLFTDQNEKATPDYAKLYVIWRDAKILEQYLFHEYKENEMYSSVYYEEQYDDKLVGKFNLKNAFTCVAIGCAEGFNNQDISDVDACYAIKNYADDDGSVLLFHDSLCPSNVPHLNSGTPTMTSILAESFGQAAISDSSTKTSGQSVTQKTLQMGYHDNMSYKGNMSQQTNNYHNYHEETDNQFLHSSKDVREFYAQRKDVGADRANRVNKGIITTYPFTIDDTLTISPTNANGFTANTDEKDMVVYYTIAGGSLGTSSSPFVANPNDGANNYFLYQYHNITYTGAGHASITGKGRDNNDERRLFINVILNSARKSTVGPDLTCHDYSSTDEKQTNSIIKESKQKESSGLVEDKAEYYTYVNSTDDTPIFSFRPSAPDGVEAIKIWYDVSCNGNDWKGVYNEKADDDGNKDVLIYDINTTNVTKIDRWNYIHDDNASEIDRYSKHFVSSTMKAEHVESGKVKRISDDTGLNYKAATYGDGTKYEDVYGLKTLEGYTPTPIKNDDGTYKFLSVSYKDPSDSDNMLTDYILDNNNEKIPLTTHYSNLKLNEKYFTGNKGKCTYICVQLTDGKNKTITRTIRVELKPELLDLN